MVDSHFLLVQLYALLYLKRVDSSLMRRVVLPRLKTCLTKQQASKA